MVVFFPDPSSATLFNKLMHYPAPAVCLGEAPWTGARAPRFENSYRILLPLNRYDLKQRPTNKVLIPLSCPPEVNCAVPPVSLHSAAATGSTIGSLLSQLALVVEFSFTFLVVSNLDF